MVMIVFVAIFLLWLLVGLGCGLPGIPRYTQTNGRMVKVQIISYVIEYQPAQLASLFALLDKHSHTLYTNR
jgi:hypothetical protein